MVGGSTFVINKSCSAQTRLAAMLLENIYLANLEMVARAFHSFSKSLSMAIRQELARQHHWLRFFVDPFL
eukprot:3492386-Karenia_brevis.AAC.1